MRFTRFTQPFLALLLLGTAALAKDNFLTKPVFDNPKKQIDSMFPKSVKAGKVAIVPFVKIKTVAAGKVHGMTQKGSGAAHATSRFVVKGLDKAFLQDIAKTVQDDLVAKLKAAGWEVLTYDDVKGDKEVQALEKLENAKNFDLPTETPGDYVYLVASPTDETNYKPAFQGMAWAWRKVAKARDAVVFVPSYQVMAPQFWVEEDKGFKTNTVMVKNAPGMSLIPRGFQMDNVNAKASPATFFNKDLYVGLGENVGTISEVSNDSPTAANAISAGLAALAGGGSVDRKSKTFAFDVNQEAYKKAFVEAAVAFNDATVTMISEIRGK